jgi:hypothetical protein
MLQCQANDVAAQETARLFERYGRTGDADARDELVVRLLRWPGASCAGTAITATTTISSRWRRSHC